MDEMTTEFGGFVLVMLAMLSVMALVLGLVALRWGWRRVRGGGVRTGLAVTNGLALAVLVNAGLVALGDGRSPLDLWLGLLVFVSGPVLAGYVLGTSLGLLRGRKAPEG